MKFQSKAKTLDKIKVKKAKIPKIFFFSVKNYKKNKIKYLKKISKEFKSFIAIRSSSLQEDSKHSSMAGYFQSFLNVDPANSTIVEKKIKAVIKSYSTSNGKNQILIQDMVKNVKMSGVATTCDKDSFAPYYHINYSKNNSTSDVTSGRGGTKNFVYYKDSPIKTENKDLRNVINLLKELEKKLKEKFLDIEFIIDKKSKVFLVQVRPIVVGKNKINQNFNNLLLKLEKKITKLQSPHHDLIGKTTAFGVMPDWNPAEMIGIKPKPLALSLYRELITDHVWSKQRRNYGYRYVDSNHLMASFFGTPYIDVRVDFNSWIPSTLNEKLANKLTNFYIKKFIKNKNYHDKIEFEIIFSCFTASTNKRLKELFKNSFSKKEINEIIKSLKKINILTFHNFSKNKKLINRLEVKQNSLVKSKMYYIDKIYWLVEDCKRFGTLPFAGLARSAFIAKDILLSFVDANILSKQEVETFLSSIHTISSDIYKNYHLLNKKNFLKKYGHLRPNTYDITSKNYSSAYKEYFQNKKITYNKIKNKNFVFNSTQKRKINNFLKKNKLNLDFDKLVIFLTESIKAREYSKYIFTKSIDLIFQNIKILGKRLGINENNLAYLNIHSILDLYYNLSNHDLKNKFLNEIKSNKYDYETNLMLKLPETITSPKDVYFYFESDNKINFVGNKRVISDVFYLKEIKKLNIKNKIVLIDSADPGYDFIFSRQIKGLITKFGGVNSHMSIRCSELNIPSAIGVGEKIFRELLSAKKINLDCQTQKIDIIK